LAKSLNPKFISSTGDTGKMVYPPDSSRTVVEFGLKVEKRGVKDRTFV